MYIHVRGQCLSCHSFDIQTQRWWWEYYLIHLWYKKAYKCSKYIIYLELFAPMQFLKHVLTMYPPLKH